MVVEMINPVFEKYKGLNFNFREFRNRESRFIDFEIVGYNRDYPNILIGKLNKKKGISGFRDLSSFDIIENHEKGNEYTYINEYLLTDKPAKALSKKVVKDNLIPVEMNFN